MCVYKGMSCGLPNRKLSLARKAATETPSQRQEPQRTRLGEEVTVTILAEAKGPKGPKKETGNWVQGPSMGPFTA